MCVYVRLRCPEVGYKKRRDSFKVSSLLDIGCDVVKAYEFVRFY